jgi:hypothetical protein
VYTFLNVFLSVWNHPNSLKSFQSNIHKAANYLESNASYAWLYILRCCNPSVEVEGVIDELANCFKSQRRSVGGLHIINAKKKKANFDLVEIERIEAANNMSYRILFMYASKLSGQEVFTDTCVWRLCVSRFDHKDAMQRLLAILALTNVFDMSAEDHGMRMAMFLLNDTFGIRDTLNYLLDALRNYFPMWQERKKNYEYLQENLFMFENIYKGELLKAAKTGYN